MFKKLLVLGAFVLLASGVSAIGAEKKVPLVVAYWGDAAELAMLNPIVDAFEKDNPDIELTRIVAPAGDYTTKVLTLLAGGGTLDVMQMENGGLEFSPKGLLDDIDPYVENSDLPLEAFYQTGLEFFQYRGVNYAFPISAYVMVLFYNKDMFDEAGLSYPTKEWNWDDFLQAAIVLTKDKDSDGKIDQFGTWMGDWTGVWIHWLLGNGGSFLNPEGTKMTINSPQSLEALQWFQNLLTKYHVAPYPEEQEGLGDLFLSKVIGMRVDGPWVVAPYRKADFNWGVTYLPEGPVERVARGGYKGLGILKKSKQKKEAWRFIEYMAVKAQSSMLKGGAAIPVMKTVEFSEDEEVWQVFSESLDFLGAENWIFGIHGMFSLIHFPAAEELLAGRWTPEKFADYLAKEGQIMLDEHWED